MTWLKPPKNEHELPIWRRLITTAVNSLFGCVGELYLSSSNRFLASSVTVTNGTITAGTVSDTWTINDTHLTVQETGVFTIDFTFTELTSDPADMTFKGRYEGNPAHHVKVYYWNYTTTAWVEATAETDDIPITAIDHLYDFLYPLDSSDYLSSGEAQIRIAHVGSAVSSHYMYTDMISITTKTYSNEIAGTWYDVDNLTVGREDSITLDAAAGTFTIKKPGWYKVDIYISLASVEGSRFSFHVFKNAEIQENIGFRRSFSSASDVGAAPTGGYLYLLEGDVVKLRLKAFVDTHYVSVSNFNFTLTKRD